VHEWEWFKISNECGCAYGYSMNKFRMGGTPDGERHGVVRSAFHFANSLLLSSPSFMNTLWVVMLDVLKR